MPDEIAHDRAEALRVIHVREVPGVRQHRDLGPRRQDCDVPGVLGGDHHVVRTPHDGQRHLACQIRTIGHRHDLSVPVDHGAQHMPDGGPHRRILEGVVDLRDLIDVLGAGQARGVREPQRRQIDMADARQGECAHHLVESRGGHRPDHRTHLRTHAAGSDQHDPLGQFGELVGKLHRDAAAEAVSDDRDPFDPQHGQQIAHPVGVPAQRVVGARFGRLAVAEQIGRDDRVMAGQQSDDRIPGVVVAGHAVQQQQRRPRAELDEGAPMAVHRHVPNTRGTGSHAPGFNHRRVGLAMMAPKRTARRRRSRQRVAPRSTPRPMISRWISLVPS